MSQRYSNDVIEFSKKIRKIMVHEFWHVRQWMNLDLRKYAESSLLWRRPTVEALNLFFHLLFPTVPIAMDVRDIIKSGRISRRDFIKLAISTSIGFGFPALIEQYVVDFKQMSIALFDREIDPSHKQCYAIEEIRENELLQFISIKVRNN